MNSDAEDIFIADYSSENSLFHLSRMKMIYSEAVTYASKLGEHWHIVNAMTLSDSDREVLDRCLLGVNPKDLWHIHASGERGIRFALLIKNK